MLSRRLRRDRQRASQTAAILASVAFVCSCSNVTTPYPLGERNLEIDASDWDGTWLSGDGEVVVFKVVDSSEGLLDAFVLEEESGTPVLSRYRARLRESNGWVFGSVAEDDSGDATGPSDYVWARVLKDEEVLTSWPPNVEKFRRLVQDGHLPGTASGSGNVDLGTLESSHYELITSETEGVLFDWEEPLVLRRVKH